RSNNILFAFGAKARSTELILQGEYGTPYLVFPTKKFKYVWSSTTFDLYDDVLNELYSTDMLETFLDRKKYKNTDLEKAVKSSREIMIQCESYIAVPMELEKSLRADLLK